MRNPTNRTVNTANEKPQVASMLPGSDGALGFRMIGMGCSVGNRYTLKWMNGTRHIPQIPRTAEYHAPAPPSATAPRSSRDPIYTKNRNRQDVTRGAQSPHV